MKKAAEVKPTPAAAPTVGPVRNVIVFDGSTMHDWPALFASLGLLSDGSRIRVLQVSWMDAEVTVHGNSQGCLIAMKPIKDTDGWFSQLTMFLLLRQCCSSLLIYICMHRDWR
jgi:hypothetical protein